jgi:hypothetical protein
MSVYVIILHDRSVNMLWLASSVMVFAPRLHLSYFATVLIYMYEIFLCYFYGFALACVYAVTVGDQHIA